MRRSKLTVAIILAVSVYAQEFDVVFSRGRVIDPETGADSVRDLGIRGKRIGAIGEPGTLSGKTTIDATGLVVTAGFIDIHQHGQTPENYALKAQDGVTTALEMEVGVWPVKPWYASRRGKSLINYGATVGHIPIRMHVLKDSGTFLPKDRAVQTQADTAQRSDILREVNQGLQEGALGVGMGLAYTPGADTQEVLPIFQAATTARVPVFVHLRSAGPGEPGGLGALEEVMAYAAASGTSLHIVHLSSTMLQKTSLALELIQTAKEHGLDFTTESYPYTAGMTEIESAIFSEGWQERNGGIDFHDLQWAATGERLTAETFLRYRKQGGMVAIHSIPESVARQVVAAPNVIVASDGILERGKGHPRAAGTYSRVLAKYVREDHALTLLQALRKMSYLPAERAGLKTKGRIRVGADADVVVFNPQKVQDHATYENPAQPSSGFTAVMVNGAFAVRDGVLQSAIFPGQGLMRSR